MKWRMLISDARHASLRQLACGEFSSKDRYPRDSSWHLHANEQTITLFTIFDAAPLFWIFLLALFNGAIFGGPRTSPERFRSFTGRNLRYWIGGSLLASAIFITRQGYFASSSR